MGSGDQERSRTRSSRKGETSRETCEETCSRKRTGHLIVLEATYLSTNKTLQRSFYESKKRTISFIEFIAAAHGSLGGADCVHLEHTGCQCRVKFRAEHVPLPRIVYSQPKLGVPQVFRRCSAGDPQDPEEPCAAAIKSIVQKDRICI